MKTLLLCGYRHTDSFESGLGLETDAVGLTLIDRKILGLRALDMQVICVVSGASADEQLRRSRYMQDTDLVFDNRSTVSLLSNAREGVATLSGESCFLLPVEIAIPPPEIWAFLHNEYAKIGFNTTESILQAAPGPQGAPWHFGFPLLITRSGCQKLQDCDDLSSLVDARLKYLHLAPEAKPL